MNRLEKRAEILNEDISLYDVCLKLRMSFSGSSDPLNQEDEDRYIAYLKCVRDTWEADCFINFLERNFDTPILYLVLSTLDFYNTK